MDARGDGPRHPGQGADGPCGAPGQHARGGRAIPRPPRGTGGADPTSGPLELSALARDPMPHGVRGALVVRSGAENCSVQVLWVPADAPPALPAGRIMLSWTETTAGAMDVTARLGLAGAQVELGFWPSLSGDWSGVVRTTLAEVTELHRALELATSMLGHLLSGSESRAAASAAKTGGPSPLGARRRRTTRRPRGRGPRQGR